MKTPRVKLDQVSRSFPTKEEPLTILRDIDLEIQPADRIVLYGPSGCGKTTLLHILALLDAPTNGDVHFLGGRTSQWTETQRCERRAGEIGMVFQQFHLLPYHSVMENLLLRLRYLPAASVDSLEPESLLDDVGLAAHSKKAARLLSGGEKQRLCIARAMLVQPSLFLADEPTGNLDTENAQRVRALFTDVAERGASMVIATHDDRWFDFATRIFRFENGRLIEESS